MSVARSDRCIRLPPRWMRFSSSVASQNTCHRIRQSNHNRGCVLWSPTSPSARRVIGDDVGSFLRRTFEKSGSQSTLDHYRAILTRFFNGPPAKLPHLYTREDIEFFLHLPERALGRVGKLTTHATRNNALSCLKSFYAYAATFAVQDDRGIPQPLMDRLAPTAGIWQTQKEKPPYRSISEEDLKKLFAAIPRDTPVGLRDYALLLTLFYTARRRHEIISLTWGSITHALIVEPGGKTRMGYQYSWYGKGHRRQIDSTELPAICYRAIVAMLEADGRFATIQPSDPLWTTCSDYIGQHGHDPHRPLADMTLYHLIKKYAKKAGLSSAITTHAFRHARRCIATCKAKTSFPYAMSFVILRSI